MIPKISVIIVNWNGKKWLDRLFNSLQSQTYPNLEVILVDNASTDGSAQYVKENYPLVNVMSSNSNNGFATGNNLGVKQATGELILLLNSDTWLETDSISRLANEYSAQQLDVIAANEANYDGEATSKWGRITIDPMGHPAFIKGIKSRNFYLPAICVLCKKSLYVQSGGLDDNFFMYCEEVDWFWRLNLMKKRVAMAEHVYVNHKGAGSTGSGIQRNIFLWRNQNTLQMLLKNYRFRTLLVIVPIYVLQNLIEILAFVFFLKPSIAFTYVEGWVYNIKNASNIIKSHKQVQQQREISDQEILQLMYHGPAKILHLRLRIASILRKQFKRSNA